MYKHIQWTRFIKIKNKINKKGEGFGLYARQPRKNLHTGISVNKPKLPVTKHDQTLIWARMYDTSRYTANTKKYSGILHAVQAVFCGEFAFVGKHVAVKCAATNIALSASDITSCRHDNNARPTHTKSGEKPLGAVTLWLKQHRPSFLSTTLSLSAVACMDGSSSFTASHHISYLFGALWPR